MPYDNHRRPAKKKTHSGTSSVRTDRPRDTGKPVSFKKEDRRDDNRYPETPQRGAKRSFAAPKDQYIPSASHVPAPRRDRIRPKPPAYLPPQPATMDAAAGVEESLPRENLIVGRNPIREAVRSDRDMERLLVAQGELSGSAREIVMMARERHIVVQTVDRSRLDAIAENHQGMIAFASAFRYSTLEDMLSLAKARGEDALLVVLDGITDPHNLGAIIRTAECVGAHGVIVPERRAVGLTPAAVKASAGAIEYLPVARAGNLSRLLDTLKAEGLWVIAADMAGEAYTAVDLTGPLAIVIGSEGSGVSRLVKEHADKRVALPIAGKIDSLNASVATGVLLYEIRRQRG